MIKAGLIGAGRISKAHLNALRDLEDKFKVIAIADPVLENAEALSQKYEIENVYTNAHVEAGLCSYNREMPEEINRVLIDHVSGILFCPTKNAVKNLEREEFKNIINNGELIDEAFVFKYIALFKAVVINVGDIMYDTLIMCLNIAKEKSDILDHLNLKSKEYYLITVHRAENTDNQEKLKNILEALSEISKIKPVIFPVHPRTQELLKNLSVKINSGLKLIDPVSYFDMLTLEKNAEIIFTDSGGVQKEAYWLKVPCITLREDSISGGYKWPLK